MKFNLKAKFALMLIAFNRFQVVNQGTNNILNSSQKGIASLDEPQLPPDMVGGYYKKGMHARSLELFTQALSAEYDVTCNEAAKEAFPNGMTMFVGEGHTGEGKNTFGHFPNQEHGIVLMETAHGEFAELCMHEAHNGLETLVCEGIDTDPVRATILASLNETLEAGKAAIKLFNPDRLKEFNPGELMDTSTIIYRYHEILSEEMASLEILPGEKVETYIEKINAYNKFEDLGMDCIDRFLNPNGSKEMLQRDETMAKNLVEHIKRRDKKHPNTTIWTYVGRLHANNVFTSANQNMKGKTPMCKVVIKDKILKKKKTKRPSL